jgi:CheY-like chemotaxis protein
MENGKFYIMLIDDNTDDNYFHEREIKKAAINAIVIPKTSGEEALEYFKSKNEKNNPNPHLIFLDINMPKMDGWEFLEEYSQLDAPLREHLIVVMLSTLNDIENINREKSWSFVVDYAIKPLTKQKLEEIKDKYIKL